ncbi:forkhead-associated domain protein [Trifolium repens]|nr:forkhead-associated domain protein [Trifolium repens]
MTLNCVRMTATSMAVPSLMMMTTTPRRRLICYCSSSTTINTEQLRSQLDHLHAEADTTRTKANSARMRLLRLSESAEKLKKQAAISMQKGDENYARDMLLQRKKVLQALEKSKSRIELLDELSTKLSEAISLKESQLVGNVTTNIEDTTEDASSPVRIIAPKEEVLKDSPEDDSDSNQIKFGDSQDVQISSESQENLPDDKEIEKLLGFLSTNTGNENNIPSSLSQISSYEEFIEHIDQKLHEIETELVAVLNVSVLVLDSEERPKNSRWQQTMELLESIHDIRQRIRSAKEAKVRI